jgi:hypothetical protein
MLDEKLTALLKTICPRVRPDFAPTDTPQPYIIYQGVGGQAFNFLDKSVPNKKNADVQISVWAVTRLEASDLIDRIEVAMIQAAEFDAEPIAAASHDYDHDTERRSARQDFSVWYDR